MDQLSSLPPLLEMDKRHIFMRMPHEYLSTVPFDLADLHVFHLLAETGSFTSAAHRAGLTQSSLTRRIQAMEQKLGAALFERTTRRVSLTEAGQYLLSESARLVGDVAAVLKRVREQFTEARLEVRVGVSRSISLAHLPGLFSANQRLHPQVLTRVSHNDSSTLLAALDQKRLDLAVLCPPRRLPPSVMITHRFDDAFTIIAPPQLQPPKSRVVSSAYRTWLMSQHWLSLHRQAQTSLQLKSWLVSQDLPIEPGMELDSYDVIIHLVALGMGLAIVPQRAIAAFPRRHSIQRLPWKARFTRELVVLARKERQPPPHLLRFVDNILF
jgi:DNA-binding transcriptional LysR family regulator